MASHTISFTMKNGQIDIKKTPEKVLQGDKVLFQSENDAFDVQFDSGHWPFVEPEATINVPAGGTTAAYTVQSSSEHDEFDNYEVRTLDRTALNSGQLEIDV